MRQLLIVFAHFLEAEAALKALKAKPIQERMLYQFDQGIILICGMGSLNAAIHVTEHIGTCSEVWNLGVVGALKETLKFGDKSGVELVEKYLSLPSPVSSHAVNVSKSTFPLLKIAEKGWKLLSSDYPLHDQKLRRELATRWDVVDMEGYGIAQAAQKAGKPLQMVKMVSDFASEGGWELIRQNLSHLSEQLASQLQEMLVKT